MFRKKQAPQNVMYICLLISHRNNWWS